MNMKNKLPGRETVVNLEKMDSETIGDLRDRTDTTEARVRIPHSEVIKIFRQTEAADFKKDGWQILKDAIPVSGWTREALSYVGRISYAASAETPNTKITDYNPQTLMALVEGSDGPTELIIKGWVLKERGDIIKGNREFWIEGSAVGTRKCQRPIEQAREWLVNTTEPKLKPYEGLVIDYPTPEIIALKQRMRDVGRVFGSVLKIVEDYEAIGKRDAASFSERIEQVVYNDDNDLIAPAFLELAALMKLYSGGSISKEDARAQYNAIVNRAMMPGVNMGGIANWREEAYPALDNLFPDIKKRSTAKVAAMPNGPNVLAGAGKPQHTKATEQKSITRDEILEIHNEIGSTKIKLLYAKLLVGRMTEGKAKNRLEARVNNGYSKAEKFASSFVGDELKTMSWSRNDVKSLVAEARQIGLEASKVLGKSYNERFTDDYEDNRTVLARTLKELGLELTSDQKRRTDERLAELVADSGGKIRGEIIYELIDDVIK
jgi:hypothetical protein